MAGAAGILDEFDGVPLYRTLKRFRTNKRDVLVCCAADDDPYTAANAAVLREHGEDVLAGLLLAAKYCGVQDVSVLVETRAEAARLSAVHPEIELLVETVAFAFACIAAFSLLTFSQDNLLLVSQTSLDKEGQLVATDAINSMFLFLSDGKFAVLTASTVVSTDPI